MTRSSTASKMRKLVIRYYESDQNQEQVTKPTKSNFVSLSATPSTAPTSSRSMHIRLGNGVEIEIPL